MSAGMGTERLLDALSCANAISDESVERVRRAHIRAGGSLVEILLRLGLCEEKALAETLARVTELELVGEAELPERAVRREELSMAFLRAARVLPIVEDGDAVLVAAADPTSAETARALCLAFGKTLRFRVGEASRIDDAILRLYGGGPSAGDEARRGVPSAADDITDTDIAHLRESASEAPIVRFVERLIARAVDGGASDIHIEPSERRLRIRLRIDGVMHDEEPAPLSWAPAVVSRIKILSHLDIAERRLPQDGSFKLNIRGREIDLRVATAPVANGETTAIRILDRENVHLDLKDLGFGEDLLTRLRLALARPNGIILVTGPTGSGKSTTLYAALAHLNVPARKVITVEDPIEYKIDGLNQIQVKPEIGLDFARALRAILRHDPDTIMVGEIRDAETARIATQAALTGHLVLSTLHTNDAGSAMTRLLDMGIEDYLITSTVVCVVAQRLARLLCTQCRRPISASGLPAGADGTFFEDVGCPACRGTGYRGRTVIAEIMEMSESVRRTVLAGAEASELRAVAMRSGMQTLYQDGMRAVAMGRTSHAEVFRVAQDLQG